MSYNLVNPTTGALTRVAGGTLYADAPIGSIQAYGGTTAPSGWLLCQGQFLKIEDYPELYAVIGTNFDRNNTVQAGKFRVPDARECVLVGYSQNNTYSAIANHDTYQLGQFKDDQLQEHGHTFQQEGGNPPSGVPINSKIIFGGSQTAAQYNTNAIQSTSVTDARTGETTHGKQLGVNYIIKAKHVGIPSDFMDAVDDEVNKIRNTQIVVGAPRTVNVKGATAERWSANLSLPTVPDGKKVLRWFAVVLSQSINTNGCATVGYMGPSGIPGSIITVPDNDGTMEIAYAAEIF